MLFLSADMIKTAEAHTMEKVSAMHLIKNAAQGLFEELKEFNSVLIYCGKGNNGSDGYATALLLNENGIYTEIVQVLPPANDDCAELCKKAIENGIPVTTSVFSPERHFDAVLDAIFGIGISGTVEDNVIRKAIDTINSSDSFIVSADIPSGMNADTGEECGVCVHADKTVTFTVPKKGMLSNSSVDLCGEIIIKEVGISTDCDDLPKIGCVPITKDFAKAILPVRKRLSHKGTFGTSVIIAGSGTMSGACAMAAMAALRSGCGLVKIIAPVSITGVLNILVKEAIVIPVPEQSGVMLPELSSVAIDAIKTADSILVGCGLGIGRHSELIANILQNCNCSVIIDADGINALSGNLDVITNKNVLITPHVKEFSRISRYSIEEIERDRLKIADEFAQKHGINLLLKGSRTIITCGKDNKYISLQATSALAKAGSGDVLAGIIVSLNAQGISLTESAAVACFIHTSAGMSAEKGIGSYGTIADDLIKLIPHSIKQLQN